jgi:hypothetical protein
MTTTQRPSREEFTAYWKDYGTFDFDVLLYIVYPGLLALYAVLVRWIDSEGRFWLPSFVVAVGYVVLYPYLIIRRVHKRFARFIRCPSCGDWFGQDTSGAYFGPNPKFGGVIETGLCSNCGEQILSDHENPPKKSGEVAV